MQQAFENYRRFLENLTVETLSELPNYVSTDVHFQDPFNDVRGIDAMGQIFRHMFENVGPVSFTVHHAQVTGQICLMSWRFKGRLFGNLWNFEGASVVTFDSDGMVAAHIDHWDAARDFYEHLPLLGWLIASIRRRLAIRSMQPPS